MMMTQEDQKEDIQDKNNITNSQLIQLIQKNNWKRKSNRSKAMKDNKNAVGNKGGPGAEKGNKRAVTTGEYENIFSGVFSSEEQKIFDNYAIKNKKKALQEELKVLTIRECRMLNRIKTLQDKNRDMTISAISKTSYQNSVSTMTHAEDTVTMIQRIEEALTRVQESKRRCIESLGKLGLDDAKLKIEKEKLKIEQKRLELELQGQEGDEIEDTSETDADLYGS